MHIKELYPCKQTYHNVLFHLDLTLTVSKLWFHKENIVTKLKKTLKRWKYILSSMCSLVICGFFFICGHNKQSFKKDIKPKHIPVDYS